jgi:Preprotein translocase subunit SecF
MLFGIVTGTFSSIYIAGPTLLWIEHRWPRGRGNEKSPARPVAPVAPVKPAAARPPVAARTR